MLQILGYLSGIISFLSYPPYVRDILLKKTTPERASWLIWSVLGSIAFFSQMAKGVSNPLWMTGVQTSGVMFIFLLALKFGTGGLTKKDLIAFVFAFFGLVLWYFTKEAAMALFIVILVDAAGSYLTIVKVYENPESETMCTWFLAGLAGFVAAMAVGSFNFILLCYPIYLWLVNWAVVAVVKMGSRKSLRSKMRD